jgi:hypothetical protein
MGHSTDCTNQRAPPTPRRVEPVKTPYSLSMTNAATTDSLTLELAGREIHITNPDRVLVEKLGATMRDLVNYYRKIEASDLRAMGGRPVLLQRFLMGG